MRIIGGSMRGTKLFTLEGDNTRPTLDRVKEALFSKINYDLQDAIVLDLFAGSGALGLEALSRGAQKSFLCDKSRDAIKIINQNIEKTRTKDKIELLNCDYKNAIIEFKNKNIKFDIVFLDPPYNKGIEDKVFNDISRVLKENSVVVLETEYVAPEYDGFEIIRQAKYGRVYITLYRLMEK